MDKEFEVRVSAMAQLFATKMKDDGGDHEVQVNQVVYSDDYVNFQAVIDKDRKINISHEDGKWIDEDKKEETEFSKMIGG